MIPLTQLLDQAFASVENSARISDGDDAFDNCKTQLRPLFEAMRECVNQLFVARRDERERILDEMGNPVLEGCGRIEIGTCYDEALDNLFKVAEEMKK